MQKIGYFAFRFFIVFLWLTPFWLLYLLADFTYFMLHKVVKYRLKVVRDNLHKCFPSKSPSELLDLEKKFYKNLSMITVESLKGLSMSAKEMQKRYKITNMEVANKYFDQGKSVIVLAAHYSNWEWAVDAVSVLKHHVIGFYKPLSNKYIDQYLKEKRADEGVELASIFETRHFFSKAQEKPSMYVLVADQNPGKAEKAIWVDFLNRDTACLRGPEFYIHLMKMPVIYFDNYRVKKGYYNLEIKDFGENLHELPQGEITKIYMKTLEEIIQREPGDWLWSHKRWKHKRIKE